MPVVFVTSSQALSSESNKEPIIWSLYHRRIWQYRIPEAPTALDYSGILYSVSKATMTSRTGARMA